MRTEISQRTSITARIEIDWKQASSFDASMNDTPVPNHNKDAYAKSCRR